MKSLTLFAIPFLLGAAVLAARQLSIPEYMANPGGFVDIPVILDDAFGLSTVELQINYDTSILSLRSISAGSLGKEFDAFIYADEEGVISLSFASKDNLLLGSGNLAIMHFAMREGAEAGLFGEIAVASYNYSNSTGVVALHRKEALAAQFGKVTASDDPMIDNAGNGLPDWWEQQHGLDPFLPNAANQDTDGDGIVEIMEFGLIGNPNVADATRIIPIQSLHEEDSETFMTLSFKRRTGSGAPSYELIESDDLGNWWNLDIDSRTLRTVNLGDGTEAIEVQGSINLKNPSTPKGFLKLEIK